MLRRDDPRARVRFRFAGKKGKIGFRPPRTVVAATIASPDVRVWHVSEVRA
jgi:hypothetical protein